MVLRNDIKLKSLEDSNMFKKRGEKNINQRAYTVKPGEENGYGGKIMQTDEDNPGLMVHNIFRHSESCPRTPWGRLRGPSNWRSM